jgi:parallel beta-helix repeat protein
VLSVKPLLLVAMLALGCAGCATGQTGEPLFVSHDSATVTGNVLTNSGGQVEYWVEYGLTRAYGSHTEHGTISVQPNEATSVSAPTFDGLSRATTYHYRLCARDSTQQGGPGCGEDRTVKTQSFACGETVTTDVHFTGRVWCRTSPLSSPGLVIGAPGITIDLHGFYLAGPGPGGANTAFGIDNSAGFDDVTIRDGYVSGFGGDGIHLVDASRNRILRVTARGTPDGIEITGGSANEVRHSRVGGVNGLLAQRTTHLIVADGYAEGDAIGIALSGVLDSRVLRNGLQTLSGGPCCRYAIRVAGDRNVIKGNGTFRWGVGLLLLSGSDNKLLDNTISESTYDGILVGASTAGTILRGNRALNNDGDGIGVQSSQTRIGDNQSNDNGDFGIDALAGVTDLGGNTATGNGNPLQCRNVFCE